MTTTDPTHKQVAFSELSLLPELIKSLASLSYEYMTPIQIESLPLILHNRDIIAQAKTGSGKTAAFGLSLLNSLKCSYFGAQGLVLCPTRELAEQVAQEIRRLACFMPNVKIINLSGGIPIRSQLDSLRHGAHIIVGTPGRVLKHLQQASLNLTQLKTLVLDEADRMLDMGFYDDIEKIISFCPSDRQTLLFSATYPDTIKQLSQQFMRTPEEIHLTSTHTDLEIEQRFYEVSKQADKYSLLKSLLLHFKPASSLIFCNTKQQTEELTARLVKEGFSAMSLNGNMEQFDRDLVVIRFANQSCSILVATDVAARGLDIKDLPVVINFDIAYEHDVHIHRIGRTGRAGNTGLVINISTHADATRLCAIEENLPQAITWEKPLELEHSGSAVLLPPMVTFRISSGKKDKIRPGDLMGAFIKDAKLPASAIGKINIASQYSYVAIHRTHADKAYQYLQKGKLKGRDMRGVRLK